MIPSRPESPTILLSIADLARELRFGTIEGSVRLRRRPKDPRAAEAAEAERRLQPSRSSIYKFLATHPELARKAIRLNGPKSHPRWLRDDVYEYIKALPRAWSEEEGVGAEI